MAPVGVPTPGPPPPPLPPPASRDHCKSAELDTKKVSDRDFVEEIKELVQRLERNRFEEGYNGTEAILAIATPLPTIVLQNGPMCGIVALIEALEILGHRNNSEEVISYTKAVLEKAILKGYTKQGEMFSVVAMQELAQEFGAQTVISDIDNDSLDDGQSFATIVRHLTAGYPLLVPYDADYNHIPSLRKGHAAHWAVIHGILCTVPYQKLSSILSMPLINSSFQILESSHPLFILKPNAPVENTRITVVDHKIITDLFASENSYVVSHQGKSFRTGLWKYIMMIESNRNLKEIAPKIAENKEDYILHDGIEQGLCSKLLLLN